MPGTAGPAARARGRQTAGARGGRDRGHRPSVGRGCGPRGGGRASAHALAQVVGPERRPFVRRPPRGRHDLLPAAVRVKEQKHLWGSCSAKGRVNLNWRLIFAPPAVFEYVVVHELCHLREAHHQAPFWRLVGEILPDFEQRRRWLKRTAICSRCGTAPQPDQAAPQMSCSGLTSSDVMLGLDPSIQGIRGSSPRMTTREWHPQLGRQAISWRRALTPGVDSGGCARGRSSPHRH